MMVMLMDDMTSMAEKEPVRIINIMLAINMEAALLYKNYNSKLKDNNYHLHNIHPLSNESGNMFTHFSFTT